MRITLTLIALAALLIPAAGAFAQETGAAASAPAIQPINMVWTLVAAFLVFFMQAGFAMVETGFTRAKNAGNIMMKNLMDFSVGSLAFFVLGFGLMFGADKLGLFGTSGFFFPGRPRPPLLASGSTPTGSSSSSLLLRRPLSYPAPWQNGPSSVRT